MACDTLVKAGFSIFSSVETHSKCSVPGTRATSTKPLRRHPSLKIAWCTAPVLRCRLLASFIRKPVSPCTVRGPGYGTHWRFCEMARL